MMEPATLMIGEVTPLLDGDLSVLKLLDASNPSNPSKTGLDVAMETTTFAHEGFGLM
jgi:hypothetical protein